MKIYKRGNVWWFSYMINGRRFQRSTGTTFKKAAQEFVDAIGVAKRAPTFEDAVEVLRHLFQTPQKEEIKLADGWQRYLEIAKATGKDQISPKSLRERRWNLLRVARWTDAHFPKNATFERFTAPIAAAFAGDLLKSGLKSKTRKNVIGDLSHIWTMIGKISPNLSNPWQGLSPRDVDGEIGKAFTVEQEAAVLAAAKTVGKDWFGVCTIMRHTGLRYSDVARLRWQDVASDGQTIHLTPHKTARHGIEVVIPITAPVREILKTQPHLGDFIFPLHAEFYGKPGQTSIVFSKVLHTAGLGGQGFTIHSWRHTAATRLAATGADIETRKRILGHTVDTTAERYDHDEHLEETRQAIERAAKPPRKGMKK